MFPGVLLCFVKLSWATSYDIILFVLVKWMYFVENLCFLNKFHLMSVLKPLNDKKREINCTCFVNLGFPDGLPGPSLHSWAPGKAPITMQRSRVIYIHATNKCHPQLQPELYTTVVSEAPAEPLTLAPPVAFHATWHKSKPSAWKPPLRLHWNARQQI